MSSFDLWFLCPVIQSSISYWQTSAGCVTQVPSFSACLDNWYLWIQPQCLLDTFALMTAATRSVNLELHDKVKPILSCLGGPSPIVLGVQASMKKTNTTFPANRHHPCRPQCARTQRADGERPPFHVRWCSQSARAPHELCPRT